MKKTTREKVGLPPILRNKNPEKSSVFAPAAPLREARRRKGIASGTIPDICLFDPDGDVVRHLRAMGEAAFTTHRPAIARAALLHHHRSSVA